MMVSLVENYIGYLFKNGGIAVTVSWDCCNESCVALMFPEDEYVALNEDANVGLLCELLGLHFA